MQPMLEGNGNQWIIDIEQKKWRDKFPCLLAMPHFSSSIEYFS